LLFANDLGCNPITRPHKPISSNPRRHGKHQTPPIFFVV
jgi:hypothetical protein